MTGLHDTDILLDDRWQLTQAADGGAPLCSELDCLYQNIALEAVTQPGDLFHDPDWGWGLYDFIQSEDDELTRLEMYQRVRTKLSKREVIRSETIRVTADFDEDTIRLSCSWQFAGETEARTLSVVASS